MDIQTILQIGIWSMAVVIVVAPIIYVNWLANGSNGEHTSHQKIAEKLSANMNIDNDVALGYKGI